MHANTNIMRPGESSVLTVPWESRESVLGATATSMMASGKTLVCTAGVCVMCVRVTREHVSTYMICTYMRTCMHTTRRAYIHPCTHTRIHIRIRTYMHTRVHHSKIPARSCAAKCARAGGYTYGRTKDADTRATTSTGSCTARANFDPMMMVVCMLYIGR